MAPRKQRAGCTHICLAFLYDYQNLQKWAEDAGLDKHLHFHLSRHTYGTMLITAGVDLYTASKMMGHADVRPTQIYAKIIDKKKEEAVSLIDKVF